MVKTNDHENMLCGARKLPRKLKKNGFTYTQILCIGNCYIYEQDLKSGIGYNDPGSTPIIKCYEVFNAKVRSVETFNGKYYPAREVFPKNEDFGYSAWSIRSLDRAILKLMQLEGHVQ